ncbi:MAG: hypothetical protein ACOH2N_07425 [Devosia sp.]
MTSSRKFSGIVLSAAMLLGVSPTTAQAQAGYSFADAAYVTTSTDVQVLTYVVCLEDENAKQPRALSTVDALEAADAECRNDRVNLPSNGPSAEDLKLSILECGFRSGQASPDMGCDVK